MAQERKSILEQVQRIATETGMNFPEAFDELQRRHAKALDDMQREQMLQIQGIIVLRFWDNEVLQNINGVLETILLRLS